PAAEPGVTSAPSASAPQPTESVREAQHEPLSVPALDELRNDPAALLSRILAIIHVPTEEPSSGEPDASGASPSDQNAAGSVVEALTSLDPGPPPDAAAEVAAMPIGDSDVMVAPPGNTGGLAPAAAAIEPESEPDLSPPARPLSVAEAVEEMLQK